MAKNKKWLLDIGCGTAPMISLLKEKYPSKKYTGIDLTPRMIEVAKSKNLDNAEFIVGDAENLPFKDNSFDIIINSQSFHHYPNPQSFFNEVSRVLKPNGKLILRDNTSAKWVLWIINNIELPHVKAHSLDEIREYCKISNLKVEKLEHRFPHRLHLVARKEK